jgi:hypothetical protein
VHGEGDHVDEAVVSQVAEESVAPVPEGGSHRQRGKSCIDLLNIKSVEGYKDSGMGNEQLV